MIHQSAIVHPSSSIAESADIGPYVVVGPDVSIGERVTVFAHAVIGRPPKTAGIVPSKEFIPGVVIGDDSVVGAHVVIYQGVTVFENVLIGDGAKIRENTTIGADCVIGSNSTLQNDVVLGYRVRIVDLSHITAGVRIGNDVFWSVGVLSMNDNLNGTGLKAPSVEDRAFIGGGSVLLPGVIVGEDAIVAAGSVVTKDVVARTRVQGVAATPYYTRMYEDMEGAHDLSYNGTPGPRLDDSA